MAATESETTVSIRLVWPFARLSGAGPRALEMLERAGVSPADFASPDTLLPHALTIALLEEAVERRGEPALGLEAGSLVEPQDFDVLEYASRACDTLGDAIACFHRYFGLMHGGAIMDTVKKGDNVLIRHRVIDGVYQPPAANDFVLSSAMTFARRNLPKKDPPVEIRFAHPQPAYVKEYARYFDAPVRFGCEANAIVEHRSALGLPMRRPDPAIALASEQHARRLLEQLHARDDVAARVRRYVLGTLGTGEVTMEATAAHLGMSAATLRRRLELESTTFRKTVDSMRRELAERYLRDSSIALNEVAFLLGFSNQAAFTRAFRRWNGAAPSAYRAGVARN